MSFLNFYIGRLAYSDESPVQNPKQKNFDFLTSGQGLLVSSPVSVIKRVAPGQTVLLDSTARSIASNLATSEFQLGFFGDTDTARLRWTGTGPTPSFRVLRAINYGSSPASTVYTAARLSPTAVQISLAGTGVDLSSVSIGDEVYFEADNGSFVSPLNPTTKGQRYTVLSVTSTSVVVRDAGNIGEETIALGSSFSSVLRFFSSSGVQVGDKIRISSSSNFNTENKLNDLEVAQVSDRDVHFYNPNLIPETVLAGVATPFSFYERLINFVAIQAAGPVKLSFDGGSEQIQLTEFSPGSAVFVSTMRAVSIHAFNPTNYELDVSVQSCTF
jgi:hypothetical protein